MTEAAKSFGATVCRLREELGLSQEALTTRANVRGMVERGEKNVTLTTITQLAEALKTPLRDLSCQPPRSCPFSMGRSPVCGV